MPVCGKQKVELIGKALEALQFKGDFSEFRIAIGAGFVCIGLVAGVEHIKTTRYFEIKNVQAMPDGRSNLVALGVIR